MASVFFILLLILSVVLVLEANQTAVSTLFGKDGKCAFLNATEIRSEGEDLVLLTIATEARGYLHSLLETSHNNGLSTLLIGWGKRWSGTTMKLELIRSALQCVRGETIVLYSDGYDSFINSPKSEILERFRSYDRRLLFSPEPDASEMSQPFKSIMLHGRRAMHKLPHLWSQDINSGGWIAYAEHAFAFFDELLHTVAIAADMNDQPLINAFVWNIAQDRFRKGMWGVDYRRDLFYALWPRSLLQAQHQVLFSFYDKKVDWTGVLEVDSTGKRLTRVSTGGNPSVIHMNGCMNLDSLLSQIGLPPSLLRNPKISQCFTKLFYTVWVATLMIALVLAFVLYQGFNLLTRLLHSRTSTRKNVRGGGTVNKEKLVASPRQAHNNNNGAVDGDDESSSYTGPTLRRRLLK